MSEPHAIKARYEAGESNRRPFLDRARQASLLTIPSLVPPEGHQPQTDLYTPYQSLGARATNNLASKLLLALMPPNQPFHRSKVSRDVLEDAATQDPELPVQIEKALAQREKLVVDEIEARAMRVSVFEALKHLIVAGNGLLRMMDDGTLKFYSLTSYVVFRDPSGNPQRIILKETMAYSELPEDVREALGEDKPRDVTVFTQYNRVLSGRWEHIQEVEGVALESTAGSVGASNLPLIPLRFSKIDGENYGRGLAEECIGDLTSLEGLSKSLVEGAAASAKLLFLINPNSVLTSKQLTDTPNGGFAVGRADDVQALQVQKSSDFTFAANFSNEISRRLSAAFLLASSVSRDAERVTAQEIQLIARELEDTLGGVYSVLAQEFLLPLVTLISNSLTSAGKLTALPTDSVTPRIITGFDALGRGHELQRLLGFVQQLSNLPRAIERLNVDNLITQMATAQGIDTEGLLRPAEEAQQDQANDLAASVTEKVAPAVAQGVVKSVTE